MSKHMENRPYIPKNGLIAGVIFGISLLAVSALAQSVPALINYQGKLTDQSGAPLPAAVYGIQFRIWDSPTASGTNDLIWAQQQNVTLQPGGAFSVVLGSPVGSPVTNASPVVNNLAYAFAGTNCYLGVTVVSSNGAVILTPSEFLPRQQILSVAFAFAAASAKTASSVIPGSIISSSLAFGSVQSTNLADGSVTQSKLSPRNIGTNVVPGGVAVSDSSGNFSGGSGVDVSNLAVTIVTTGRPVFVGLIADGSTNTDSYIGMQGNVYGDVTIGLSRDSSIISRQSFHTGDAGQTSYSYFKAPVSVFSHVDLPPAGAHTFKVTIISVTYSAFVQNARLIAYEL
jgi:hypothetical protein